MKYFKLIKGNLNLFIFVCDATCAGFYASHVGAISGLSLMIPSDLVDQTIAENSSQTALLYTWLESFRLPLAPAALLRDNGNMGVNGSEWENGFSFLLGEVVGRRVRKDG